MKKIIFLFLLALAGSNYALCEKRTVPLQTHQTGVSDVLTEIERHPIDLPIAAYYDSETNILEVWCGINILSFDTPS